MARTAASVIAVLGLTVLGVLLTGHGQSSAVTAAPATSESGRVIWLSDCATCHQPDGAGSSRGPDLRRVGPAMVDFMVSTGRMPLASPTSRERRRDVHYSATQIRSLDAYVTAFIHGPSIPYVDIRRADLGVGGSFYRAQCAACHQAAGGGGALAHGAEAPNLRNATAVQVVEAMRTGPGDMPVFDPRTVPPAQATAIAAYVEYLHHARNPGGIDLAHLGPVPEGLVAWSVGLLALIIVARLLGTRAQPTRHGHQT